MQVEEELQGFPESGGDDGEFEDYLNSLRLEGFTWLQIAEELGVGEKRLDKWRKENSYQDLFRNVDCYPKKLVEQMRLGAFLQRIYLWKWPSFSMNTYHCL